MGGVADGLVIGLALLAGAALAAAFSLLGWTRTRRALRAVEGVNRGLQTELARVEEEVAALEDQTRALGRRAEAAEELGASRLGAFLDNSSALMSFKDPFGRYRFVNRSFASAVGAQADAVLGTSDHDHWPSVASELRGHDQQVLVRRRSARFEEVLPLPDGEHTFLTVRFPILDPDGVPTGVGAVATDITELTRVRDSVAGRERVLSTVIAASPDAISIVEEDGTIRSASMAFERIFGHPVRGVVDRCLFELVHPDDVDGASAVLDGLGTADGRRATLRFRAGRADGRWVTIESHAQLMVDEAGGGDGIVMVSRDISDQIALEAALRTAKEHAEHASSVKSEFLSRVSHELRTPLNAMLGFAQLLELEELGEQASECVDQIMRAGDHLLDLINDVLDIARIESDHMDLRIEPLDASHALREVLRLTEPLAARAGVTLVDGCDPHTDDDAAAGITVLGDRQRLLQVLLNLVSNAIKYNVADGSVEVEVSVTPAGTAHLAVTDTGDGLDDDQLARVFVPFDRLGFEHSSVEGTGVGLPLSRGLAERMGGTLGVRSTRGVGSTFWIELPLAPADDHVEATGAARPLATTTAATATAATAPLAVTPAAAGTTPRGLPGEHR
jgi:PAS domain S-box-containing protein